MTFRQMKDYLERQEPGRRFHISQLNYWANYEEEKLSTQES